MNAIKLKANVRSRTFQLQRDRIGVNVYQVYMMRCRQIALALEWSMACLWLSLEIYYVVRMEWFKLFFLSSILLE